MEIQKTTIEQYKRAAEYVAMQCAGCSDSPMILAIKAHKSMLEAASRGDNPYPILQKLNYSLI